MYKYITYLLLIVLFASCAQITPLTGGKKDITPPLALKYVPDKGSVNFKAKTIEIAFDEFIVLKDLANQFIMTPQPKTPPEIQANGKKLKISFEEELLPNTTYKLAFGSCITDLHESNAVPNFEYVFSTGSVIDSLKLKGTIQNYFDKKASAGFLVCLYDANANDSVIYNNKPLYISKTSASGGFEFNYLPQNTFKLIAILDKNKNMQYDGSEEEIAFSSENINTIDTSKIILKSFKEIPSKSFIKKQSVLEPGKLVVVYNKAQNNIKDVICEELVSYNLNQHSDSLYIYHQSTKDTLLVNIEYQNNKTDSLLFKIQRPAKSKDKALKYTTTCNCNNTLDYFKKPILKFNFPVKQEDIDESKIVLYEWRDSLKTKMTFKLEAIDKTLTSYVLVMDQKTNTKYQLNLDKNAIKNISKRHSDSVVYKYQTNSAEQFASLDLKLLFPSKGAYIIQLLNDKNQIVNQQTISLSLTSSAEKTIRYNNVAAGNYHVKAIVDKNTNGVFDTGNYLLKQQAEEIYMTITPIKVLAGWEIEHEWMLK